MVVGARKREMERNMAIGMYRMMLPVVHCTSGQIDCLIDLSGHPTANVISPVSVVLGLCLEVAVFLHRWMLVRSITDLVCACEGIPQVFAPAGNSLAGTIPSRYSELTTDFLACVKV